MKIKKTLLLAISSLLISSCGIIRIMPEESASNRSSVFISAVSEGTDAFSSQNDQLVSNINTSSVCSSISEEKNGISLGEENRFNGENIVNVDGVRFEVKNGSICSDGFVILNKGGFLRNIDPYSIESIYTVYSKVLPENEVLQNEYGYGDLYWTFDSYFIDNPFSSKKDAVSGFKTLDGNDHFFSIYTFNRFKITSLDLFGFVPETDSTAANESFDINLLTTNDIHGQVYSNDSYSGLSEATSFIEDKKGNYNILLDQGDVYQGSLASYLTNGNIMMDFLHYNGFDSTILGNHEFDYGVEKVQEYCNYSPISYLCNNLRTTTGHTPDWTEPYKLIERHGVKIGLIGSIGDVRSSISASKIDGYTFLTGSKLTNQIISDSQKLKEMGADLVILQIHDGVESSSLSYASTSSLSYYDVDALSGSYIDLVLEGHTEISYSFKDAKGVWHSQNGGHLKSLSEIKLSCTLDNGKYSISINDPYYTTASKLKYFEQDENMNQLIDYYKKFSFGEINDKVAMQNLKVSMSSGVLTELMAELYFDFGHKYNENVVYGGGFIKTRAPYNITKGVVTYGKIYEVFPFDNEILICSCKGYVLKDYFLESDNSNYHHYSLLESYEIVDSSIYYVVVDSYTVDYLNYSSKKLTVVDDLTARTGLYARDLLFDYFIN